ncbi:hypothetical protein F5Y17DRAFT_470059 [Xylariaceae sp. FL0594]|nr:hypothetical protein F5Y17DRAFT_470059 [Xylariaceae sp. FL0594]
MEYVASPDEALSRSASFASSRSLPRSSSSAIYTPQSLHAPSSVSSESTPTQETFPYVPENMASSSAVAPVARSNRTADTVSSLHSTEYSNASIASSNAQQPPPAISDVNAKRSPALMPTHPGADSVPMSAVYNPEFSPRTVDGGEGAYNYSMRPGYYPYNHPDCFLRRDVHVKRRSWLYVTLICLSIYSTGLSGLWLVVSIVQPRYGRSISTGVGWQLTPSSATLLATLAARTIELSFVTVFVAVLGQVLTRRAFNRNSKGMSLAEMTMRNWVIQPGSLITHWEGFPKAGTTLLGALTLTATLCSLLYTTASDAMVSPKLKFQDWEYVDMKGTVKVAYSNPYYVVQTCQTPLGKLDPDFSGASCLGATFSGQSYHSLITYLTEWAATENSPNPTANKLEDRPTAKHNLYDNTTMESSWIETEYSDVNEAYRQHKRIINNATLAMPHPGVYAAATDPINGILQPDELLGVGQYKLEAAVVSPVINVLCVNMNKTELAPIVYTEWPQAHVQGTDIPGQTVGMPSIWSQDVPPSSPTEWYNRTVVDDIFRWGEEYNRRPPIFPLYPIDYNMITNISWDYSESLYVLGKSPNIDDYTLCEMRSWVTPKCSTVFELSGTSGGHMRAHCEDPGNAVSYEHVYPDNSTNPPRPSGDWRNLANEWRLSIDLNGGAQNSNASNARILTELILSEPGGGLDPRLPSAAEALAVLATSTLVVGSLDSTFQPVWIYQSMHAEQLDKPVYEVFRAKMQTQQYASAHTEAWQQVIFYPVLLLVFALNVLCLLYLVLGTSIASWSPSSPPSPSPTSTESTSRLLSPSKNRWFGWFSNRNRSRKAGYRKGNENVSRLNSNKSTQGLVTDYTEPQNLFALAINSPPSRSLAGSCGHGPNKTELVTPWYVSFGPDANHYFFESGASGGDFLSRMERGEGEIHDAGAGDGCNTGTGEGTESEVKGKGNGGGGGRFRKSYKRLSSRRSWL